MRKRRLAFELGDLVIEAEVLEDGADVGGEAADVFEEVLGDVVGCAAEFFEIEFAGVVEVLAGGFAEEGVGGLAVPLLLGFEDLGLGGGEDAIEAAEDGHGEHDFAVLGGAVGAAERVGDIPDEVDFVAEVIHEVVFSIVDGAGMVRSHEADV
jgi:hypothetical protein